VSAVPASRAPLAGDVRIAMIGGGFMGRAHAAALAAFPVLLPEAGVRPILDLVVEANPALAAAAQERLGFARSTVDWRAAINDPDIDVVDIVLPNALHYEVARAALEAGKHVMCEKPLTVKLDEARTLARLAEEAGVVHQVGFNWRLTPAIQQARRLIVDGSLGEVRSIRTRWLGEFFADPTVPRLWRFERAVAGSGALGDLGSHAIDFARFLGGDIEAVCGLQRTFIPTRPDPEDPARMQPVDVDDMTSFLVEFESGATGHIECSWAYPGRKSHAQVEVHGSRGSLLFDWERMNEFQLYEGNDPEDRQGYRTVLVGPAHPGAAAFVPSAGYQMGYLETKVLQMQDFFAAATGRVTAPQTDFSAGYECLRVEHAVEASVENRAWQRVADFH